MKLKLMLVASALAGVAACGAVQGPAAATTALPSCTTWTAASGSVAVLRLRETGTKVTGTETTAGLTAKVSGTITGPGRFTGFAQVGKAFTLALNAVFTSSTIKLAGKNGHDVFTTSHGCP